jgi:hypothetical protein
LPKNIILPLFKEVLRFEYIILLSTAALYTELKLKVLQQLSLQTTQIKNIFEISPEISEVKQTESNDLPLCIITHTACKMRIKVVTGVLITFKLSHIFEREYLGYMFQTYNVFQLVQIIR